MRDGSDIERSSKERLLREKEEALAKIYRLETDLRVRSFIVLCSSSPCQSFILFTRTGLARRQARSRDEDRADEKRAGRRIEDY